MAFKRIADAKQRRVNLIITIRYSLFQQFSNGYYIIGVYILYESFLFRPTNFLKFICHRSSNPINYVDFSETTIFDMYSRIVKNQTLVFKSSVRELMLIFSNFSDELVRMNWSNSYSCWWVISYNFELIGVFLRVILSCKNGVFGSLHGCYEEFSFIVFIISSDFKVIAQSLVFL